MGNLYIKSPTALTLNIQNVPFDTLYPCRYEVMTFSEKEITHGWLRSLWGAIQSAWGGSIIGLVISAVDAKAIAEKAVKEKWNINKLVEETKRVSQKSKNVAKIVWGVESVLFLLSSGLLACVGAFIPAIAYLIVAAICVIFGFTIGQLLAKRGFVRMLEGFVEKKIMNKL